MKSNIYTTTGDSGNTSLVGGLRVKKTHPRIEAYGTIDELNAHLGVLGGSPSLHADAELIRGIQNKLFNIGAYLATDNPDDDLSRCEGLTEDDVTSLERAIDRIDAQLPPLRRFILPGGTQTASLAHVARTMCRRCERRVLQLQDYAYVDPTVLRFINRLSDYLFVLARLCNVNGQVEELFWDKDCRLL
ncbi:MAG: cob(I)yrinic acid a,c-diamide adenosyltransferase [Bacteroidales bacterium]|nr:cob(I)yrinic acid a,c-diamide adenosyltransferase [Bacteroidales bacterium]